MKKFISDHFMLQSDEAVRLYHEFAADLPIIDYHCHPAARRGGTGQNLGEPFAGLVER